MDPIEKNEKKNSWLIILHTVFLRLSKENPLKIQNIIIQKL